MNILLDTNIMLDFLTKREPFFDNADLIMRMCRKKELEGFIAAHSIMNAFFILRKEYTVQERREILQNYMKLVSVVGVDGYIIERALKREDFFDVEDCLQDECALICKADFIITRNVSDFKCSKIPAIDPDTFLKKVN